MSNHVHKITLLILLLAFPYALAAQNDSPDKLLEEMNNALKLNMEQEAKKIGLELITYHDKSYAGEKALFDLGNYFHSKAVLLDNSENDYLRSFFLYKQYLRKYPDGEFVDQVKERTLNIASEMQYLTEAIDSIEEYVIEERLVSRKLDIANVFADSLRSEGYSDRDGLASLFANIDASHTKIYNEITNEIISSHSQFELLGYYKKIFTIAANMNKDFGEVKHEYSSVDELLSKKKARVEYNTSNDVVKGLRNFYPNAEVLEIKYHEYDDRVTVKPKYGKNGAASESLSLEEAIAKLTQPSQLNENYRRLYGYITYLSKKYPQNEALNTLHLYFVKKYIENNKEGEYDFVTRYHLEYVIQNSQDQGSYKYLLAKEFVENNKFMSPPSDMLKNPFLP